MKGGAVKPTHSHPWTLPIKWPFPAAICAAVKINHRLKSYLPCSFLSPSHQSIHSLSLSLSPPQTSLTHLAYTPTLPSILKSHPVLTYSSSRRFTPCRDTNWFFFSLSFFFSCLLFLHLSWALHQWWKKDSNPFVVQKRPEKLKSLMWKMFL